MANTPQFAAAPVVGSSVLSATASATSYTTPTHTVTILTATAARQFKDGHTTSGSTTVTSATGASFQNGDLGRPISGSGIPAGATVVAVASATSITISKPATATATTVTVTLGGGNGLKIEEIDVVGTGVTVAGICNLFLKDAGGAFHYIGGVKITVVTPSTAQLPFGATPNTNTGKIRPPNNWLPANWSLVAASFVASQKANVVAYAGAF